MEEWTELRDDDYDDDDGNAEGIDLNFRIENYRFDSRKESLRSLFDQLLDAFMKDKSDSKCIRPIPVLCGDGRPIDLFKLFWVVRKIGGHEPVSRNNLWGFVSEECGLGFGAIPSVKLIYMKYLEELDQWLGQVFSKRFLEDGRSELVQNLDLLSRELEIRFRSLVPDEQEQDKDSKFLNDNKGRADIALDINETDLRRYTNGSVSDHFVCSAMMVVEKAVKEAKGFSEGLMDDGSGNSCNEESGNGIASAKKVIEKVINKALNCGETIGAAADNDGDDDDGKFPVHEKNDVCISANKVVKKVISKTHDLSGNNTDGEERFSAQQGIANMIPARSDVQNVQESRKRKRQSQSFSGMLNWLLHVAKHSDDPSVGLIPECSKWSNYGNEELWVQATLVREALLIRKYAKANEAENPQKDQHKKPRMHPSMYEDDVLDHQSTEKLRCSKRTPLTKSYLCPCCNSSAPPQIKDTTTHLEAMDARNSPGPQVKTVHTNVEELPTKSNDHKSSDMPVEKHVSVGPTFQAEIPKWTGVVTESDPKWLGKRMWPPENGEKKPVARLDGIGKGRHHPCNNCPFQDSVECVRFHIAEKRLRLKQEIGSLFYRWRFDRMGEEVSLSWTEVEENRFKDMMRSCAESPNKFWNNAKRFLPSKTREKLVSYYFNVFVVQRRSYQNRVTPKDVDSDDDEKECGSIGSGFGRKALYIPGLRSITCTLNKASTEFV